MVSPSWAVVEAMRARDRAHGLECAIRQGERVKLTGRLFLLPSLQSGAAIGAAAAAGEGRVVAARRAPAACSEAARRSARLRLDWALAERGDCRGRRVQPLLRLRRGCCGGCPLQLAQQRRRTTSRRRVDDDPRRRLMRVVEGWIDGMRVDGY